MEVKEYFQIKAKLTNNCEMICGKCRLHYSNNGKGLLCNKFECKYPEKAEKIVSDWWEEESALQFSLMRIKAIEGRITEGYMYAARDFTNGAVFLYTAEPVRKGRVFTTGKDGSCSKTHSNLYSFVTNENSPVHLPTLLKTLEGRV